MYERTRFGTTPHSQKVVQDSDAYRSTVDGEIKAPTSVVLIVAGRVGVSRHHKKSPAGAFCKMPSDSICIAPSPVSIPHRAHHETARRPSARSSWPHSR